MGRSRSSSQTSNATTLQYDFHWLFLLEHADIPLEKRAATNTAMLLKAYSIGSIPLTGINHLKPLGNVTAIPHVCRIRDDRFSSPMHMSGKHPLMNRLVVEITSLCQASSASIREVMM